MLEAMTPEQFDERLAHWELTRWGEEREGVAMLLAGLHNAATLILGALYQFQPPNEMFRAEADFMPGAKPKADTRRRLTAQEAEHMDKIRYGVK